MDHLWYEESSRKPTWSKHFPVVGQGTVFFNIIRGTHFTIVVRPATSDTPNWQWIALEVYKNKARFLLGRSNSKPEELSKTEGDDVGFDPNEKTNYWLSFDRDRLVVKYGKGYCMVETTLLSHRFLTDSDKENQQIRKQLEYLFNPVTKKLIEFYDCKPAVDLARFYAAKELTLSKLLPGEIDEIDFHVSKPVLQELETAKGKQAHAKAKSIVDVESKVSFMRYPLVQNCMVSAAPITGNRGHPVF